MAIVETSRDLVKELDDIISICKKSKTTMCYVTSQELMDKVTGQEVKYKFTDLEAFMSSLIPVVIKDDPTTMLANLSLEHSSQKQSDVTITKGPKGGTNRVYNIEIHINSRYPFNHEKRYKLKRKYNLRIHNNFHNYVMKNDILRLFTHAFNIVILGEKVLILQSWFKISNYDIIYQFNMDEYTDFLKNLRLALENFILVPAVLFRLFKVDPDLPICTMITKENILVNREYVLNYKDL